MEQFETRLANCLENGHTVSFSLSFRVSIDRRCLQLGKQKILWSGVNVVTRHKRHLELQYLDHLAVRIRYLTPRGRIGRQKKLDQVYNALEKGLAWANSTGREMLLQQSGFTVAMDGPQRLNAKLGTKGPKPPANLVPQFKDRFCVADDAGDYRSFSGNLVVQVTDSDLWIGRAQIPLHRINGAFWHGHSLIISYLDEHDIANLVPLTTVPIFVFTLNRQTRLNALADALLPAAAQARGMSSRYEELIAAAADACFICGERGGSQVKHVRVISLIKMSLTDEEDQVLCPAHITRTVLPRMIVTALFGWWSLGGLIATPLALGHNWRALKSSSLPGWCRYLAGLLVLGVALIPLYILAVVVMEIVHSESP